MMLMFIAWIILGFYGLIIMIGYYYFSRLNEFIPSNSGTTSLSIIIAARNEEERIGRCIESLLIQDYPAELVEIIIVDDQSIDKTADVIKLYSSKGVQLISIQSTDNLSGKKAAITRAISVAKNKLIISTDADCTMNPAWLSTLVSFYETTGSVFIAGPVKFEKEKSLLDIFQSLDFLSLQGITAAGVSAGFLNMCNGANLAYEKSAFEKVNGFEGINNIASGDDMLLMEKISAQFPGKARYCFSKNAIVETASAGTIRDFIRQRIRWASKAKYYKNSMMKSTLALVYITNFLLFGCLVYGLVNIYFLKMWLMMTLLKTAIEIPFMLRVAAFFDKKNIIPWFLPIQPLHNLYTVVAGFFGLFPGYTWKGRKLK